MAKYEHETVLSVTHWTDTLFSFTTTRRETLRFRNGEFIMIGLQPPGEARPIMRAYSIASANHEEFLEFYSIKVPDGPLTSHLANIKVGDEVLIGSKPTGTLVTDDLLPGKHLWLLGTGTGLAPFLSIIKDPEVYERFDKIVLFHGVRYVRELGYHNYLQTTLPAHEYLGEAVREKLLYYPCVTREPFVHQGRITELLKSGRIASELGLPPISPETDRFMICGSPAMLADTRQCLDEMGYKASPRTGVPGDYNFERSFVDRG
ncbi:ferredoxin--NADP reductase [Granulosicoccaceae sp. 1_MG-2023]|nr:ferredoxin--NADP reductase [Granulosicoccaceae sp. 1_MG-2023]